MEGSLVAKRALKAANNTEGAISDYTCVRFDQSYYGRVGRRAGQGHVLGGGCKTHPRTHAACWEGKSAS